MNNNIIDSDLKSGIYQIRNLVNNKIYIGQSINIERRKREHFKTLRADSHYNDYLQNAYNKYGKHSFAFEVIDRCEKEELNDRENFWITKRESTDKNKGYNLRSGGNKHELSEYSRKKMSSTRIERIRSGLIKPCIVIFTDEMKRKMSESQKKRYRDDPEIIIQLSEARSTVDTKTVKDIKLMLKDNLEASCEDVAKLFDVSTVIVTHIMHLNSHKHILKEYNQVIKNRTNISELRKDKVIIRMYRNGCSYSDMGKEVGLHIRNVIRRINKMVTKHDDRCRLNHINKAIKKRTSLIKTLNKMGKNSVEISKTLKVSRGTVGKVIKGNELLLFDDVNKTRGKPKVFEYKNINANNHPIKQDGMQLAFVF